jgi:hypothetical protein
MNKDLQETIFNAFPEIFPEEGRKRPSLMADITCGDGWYELIRRLCVMMQHRCDEVQYHKKINLQVRALQVKEKFNGLRFYCTGEDDYIRGLIGFAEIMSYIICPECGNARCSGSFLCSADDCKKRSL